LRTRRRRTHFWFWELSLLWQLLRPFGISWCEDRLACRIIIRCARSRGPRGFFCLHDFCRGPVNPDVIRLESCSHMRVLSIRTVYAVTSLACLLLAFLLVVYLVAAGADWLALEHVALKFAAGSAVVLSLYFGSCAACNCLLWIGLFENKTFLNVLGSVAAIASVYCLFLTIPRFLHMNLDWVHLALLSLLSFVAATCIRAGTGWRAFGVLSLLYSLPLGLLSIGPISYFLFPPPPDPVGGNGVNAGILLMLMVPFAFVALPTWIASMIFERWRVVWRLAVGLLCLPGSVAVAYFLFKIAR